MNTPNPLIPQGTFPDNRGRSHIRIAVFTILAVHLVLLGALLMAGCKKTDTENATDKAATTNYPPVTLPETNLPGPTGSAATPIVSPPIPIATSAPPSDASVTLPGADHVVVRNDSFYTLGKKYGVSTRAIAEANPGVDATKLKIGQKLKIPGASAGVSSASPVAAGSGNGSATGGDKTYTVKSGDTLMKIAKTHGIGVKLLRSANGLKTDQIKVGQKLRIPSKISAAAPESISTSSVPVSPP